MVIALLAGPLGAQSESAAGAAREADSVDEVPAPQADAPPSAQATGPIAQLTAMARAQLAQQGFARHQTEISGQPFVWWEKGEGSPVVFLHGVTSQAGGWLLVAPQLTSDHRVLLVDLPGHGESGPAAGPLAMSTILAGFEGWLASPVLAAGDDAAEHPRPVLVGNSMGAWLATLVAHRHPGWVSRVILVNGGPLPFDPGDLDLLPADRKEARRLMAVLRDPSSPATPDVLLDDLVRRAEGGEVARMLAAEEDLESHFLTGRLAEIHTPVDILWGESDRYMGRDYPERLVSQLPAARLEGLPKCGHLPQVECPARLIEALKTALAAAPPEAKRNEAEAEPSSADAGNSDAEN